MRKWSSCWLIAGILLLIAAPAAAQTPPITFEDPLPTISVWPGPVKATVLNNTTETLMVTIQVTNLRDVVTGATMPASDLLQPIAPSVTIPPAGQAALSLPVNQSLQLAQGELTGSLVLSVPSHNSVLRKPFSLIILTPDTEDQVTPNLVPAVESWTLTAVRVLPFVKPICLRGLTVGCAIPLSVSNDPTELPYAVGHLTNPAGGGLSAKLTDIDKSNYARLSLDFDRHWGLAGTYTGILNLTGDDQVSGGTPAAVTTTVRVKDTIIWPLLILSLGIVAARQGQHYLIVRPRTQKLMDRLDTAALAFSKLRKSVHGYTVSEDFQAQRDVLAGKIRKWDRAHYGEPTDRERQQLATEILDPLTDLENALQLWTQFREKLDRLGHRLLKDAKPTIQQAPRPSDIQLEEPRFYTASRLLLRGAKLRMSQVADYAQRIDDAAELAGKWGNLEQLAVLAKDAIQQLSAPGVDLSESESEMLEAARHHLNSAARDLWEAQNLTELRDRETEAELTTAQELTRRLLDPFVYYTGTETPVPQETTSGTTEHETAAFSAQSDDTLSPMVRTYARIDTYRLPRLGFEAYQSPRADRSASPDSRGLVSERVVTATALVTALLLGLNRYFTTDFGTTADYLAMIALGLTSKAGLEIANLVMGRLLRARE